MNFNSNRPGYRRIILALVLLICPCFSRADSAPTTMPASPVVTWPWQYSVDSISQLATGQADEATQADPIEPMVVHMGDVVTDLSDLKTDAPVQAKQKQIVSSFDSLIAQLEKQLRSGNGGSNPNPTRPMARSVLAGGPGGSGPLHDPRAGSRVWGQLPPKERDQILQSQTEGFPPGYEAVLASYYARMSQSSGDSDADAVRSAPTTQPANP